MAFAGTDHTLRVHSVHSEPGALEFSVDLDGRTHDLFVRTSLAVAPGADIAVALTLVPAMIRADRLEVEAPVDETLLRRLPEIQAVWRAFQLGGDWTPATEVKRDVEIVCPSAPPPPPQPERGVAAFFSAGVDSFATVDRHPEITHLIYIAGMDAPVGPEFTGHHAMVRETIAGIAERLGKSLITMETNARSLYAAMQLVGPTYGGGVLAASARLTAPAMRRVYVGASQRHGELLENSTHPVLEPLWGRDVVEIVHDGAELKRTEKLELIAEDAVARDSLRVCWAGSGSDYNCCACEKCLRTMATLEAIGALDRFPTFAKPLDLGLVARTRPAVRHELAYWIEVLELAIERSADPALVDAVKSAIALADPGTIPRPPRSALANPAPPRHRALFMSPSLPEALGGRSAAFLIGSRSVARTPVADARLDVARGLARRACEAAVVPVIALADPRTGEVDPAFAAGSPQDDPLLAYAPGTDGERLAIELGLIPAGLPAEMPRAAVYLYGGAYLNGRDAEPVLSMTEGVRALVERAGAPPAALVSSGLQIDPDWARAAGVRYGRLFAALDCLRVSDELSLHAARFLSRENGELPVRLSGDDLDEDRQTDDELIAALRAALDPADAPPAPPSIDRHAASDYARLVAVHRDTVARLRAETARGDQLAAELDAVVGSKSWRLTSSLRRAKQRLRGTR